VLGSLRTGDIYTHCYSCWAGEGGSIVDRQAGRVRGEAWAARARGVLFDLGHGQGSLDWEVAEVAMEEGFHPDIIRCSHGVTACCPSTDLHSGNVSGSCRSLPWVLSKMVHLGGSLPTLHSCHQGSP